MLRVRIDGGALTSRAAAGDRPDLASTSPATPPTSPTGRTCSCTGSGSRTCRRSGAGWRRSGCRTTEACGDCPRVILGSPVAGIAADEIIDGTPAIQDIADRYIGDPAVLQPAAQVQDRDHRSPAARTWRTRSTTSPSSASSTPSTDPASTCGSAAACPPTRCWPSGSAPGCRSEEVAEVWAGVVGVFRDYGYRRLRTRARIKFLVADWGPEKFREVLENEYLQAQADRRPGPGAPRSGRATTSACTAQKDGRFYVGLAAASPAGSAAATLIELADLAEAHGSGRLRTTPMQKILVLDVAEPTRSTSLVAGAEALGLSARPNAWRRVGDGLHRHRVLQARDRRDQGPAARVIDELERRLGGLDEPITINVNGCPNSCARIQVADIGLKGQLVPGRRRRPGRGLPGAPGRRARPGRRLRPQAARPQGHRRRAARLRRAGGPELPGRARPTASASRSGSPRADEAVLV